jgi:hypothetical protein
VLGREALTIVVAEAAAEHEPAPQIEEKAKERIEGTVRRAKGASVYL